MRLELAADLPEHTLHVPQPGVTAPMDTYHRAQQFLDPREGLAKTAVVHRDDVLA
jgi:hypothetical protein